MEKISFDKLSKSLDGLNAHGLYIDAQLTFDPRIDADIYIQRTVDAEGNFQISLHTVEGVKVGSSAQMHNAVNSNNASAVNYLVDSYFMLCKDNPETIKISDQPIAVVTGKMQNGRAVITGFGSGVGVDYENIREKEGSNFRNTKYSPSAAAIENLVKATCALASQMGCREIVKEPGSNMNSFCNSLSYLMEKGVLDFSGGLSGSGDQTNKSREKMQDFEKAFNQIGFTDAKGFMDSMRYYLKHRREKMPEGAMKPLKPSNTNRFHKSTSFNVLGEYGGSFTLGSLLYIIDEMGRV